MKKLLFIIALLFAARAHGQTYHNCTATITAASISCTFSYSAGDYWYMQTGGFVGGVIPPTGCGTWIQAAPDNTTNGTDMGYYRQYFTSSGSCTVTESPTGGSSGTALGMGIVGVSGLPAYAPEAMIPSIGTASPLVATQSSSQAGDVALFLGMANNSSTLAVSGYAAQGSNFVSNVSLGQFSATLGAAGSQTATMTTTNDPPKGIFVLLRTSVPSQGFQQINSNTCSPCAGSISVTLPFASASGDIVRIAGYAIVASTSLTNNGGQNCYPAPNPQGLGPPPTTWNCPVVSPPTTPITYTLNFTGTATADLIGWEFAGPPSTHYVATNSGLESRDIGPTSVSAGPIFIRQNGAYYIDSMVTGTVNSPFRPYTPSTGFMSRAFLPLNSRITGIYDGVFSVTGAGDSFNSTVSIVNGSDSLFGAWMWAYALGSQYQDIEIAQTASDNINGTFSIPAVLNWNEPTSGCSLLISGQSDGGATWSTPSGSPSLSWSLLQGGGSGQTYALWEADSVPSGVITTNINSSVASRSAGVKVCNSGPSTSSAALTSASSSAGPLSISSTTASPMILGFGGLAGNGSGAYIAASSSQIYAINQYGFNDNISTAAYSFLATTPTTTSLTISDPGSASSFATVMLVAMPSSFAPTSNLIIQGATVQGATVQ